MGIGSVRRSRILIGVAIGTLLAPDLARAVSVADEKALGRRFALEAAGQLPTVSDPVVLDLVRDLGERLVDTLGPQAFDYQFQVVAHPALNAFAVPGGYIWVFSGLIARVSNIDELAGVIGHEVAHVHAHHVARQQEETRLWNYAALLGVLLSAVQPVLGAGAIAAAQAAGLRYTREFEEEADYLGLRFMTTAGYDAKAMPSFFKKVLAEQRLNPTGMPPYLLTHPLTEDRITKVETSVAVFERERRATAPAAERELEEARAVIQASVGSTDAVFAEYGRRADAAPEDGFARYLFGVVASTMGRYDAALSAFERAARLKGAGRRLPVRLAYVYLRQGRAADARARLAPYVGTHERDWAARALLGQTLLELGDEAGGISALEASVTLDPSRPEAHQLLGVTYGRGGRSGEAFFHLAKAHELRGKLPEALSYYIRARDALGPTHARAEAIGESITELGEIVGAQQRMRSR
jgi:predicted Zn-dependent protease